MSKRVHVTCGDVKKVITVADDDTVGAIQAAFPSLNGFRIQLWLSDFGDFVDIESDTVVDNCARINVVSTMRNAMPSSQPSTSQSPSTSHSTVSADPSTDDHDELQPASGVSGTSARIPWPLVWTVPENLFSDEVKKALTNAKTYHDLLVKHRRQIIQAHFDAMLRHAMQECTIVFHYCLS